METCRCGFFPLKCGSVFGWTVATQPWPYLLWPAAFCIVSLKQKDTRFSSDELKTLRCVESVSCRHHVHYCEIKNRPQEHNSVPLHLRTQSGRQDMWIPSLCRRHRTENHAAWKSRVITWNLLDLNPSHQLRRTLDISQILCGLWIQGSCPNRTLLRKVVLVSRVMCSI